MNYKYKIHEFEYLWSIQYIEFENFYKNILNTLLSEKFIYRLLQVIENLNINNKKNYNKII